MSNLFRIGVLACVLSFSASLSLATPVGPSAHANIKGKEHAFQAAESGKSDVKKLHLEVVDPEFQIVGDVALKSDPYILYGFSVINLTNTPLAFSFNASTPYVGGPYLLARSSHSSSVTDGDFNGSVVVTDGAGGVHQPFYDGTPFGAIFGGGSLTGNSGFSSSLVSTTLSGISVSTAANGTLSIDLAGTISARDIYTFNGLAELQPVPEPAAVLLLGSGLLALGRRFRRT